MSNFTGIWTGGRGRMFKYSRKDYHYITETCSPREEDEEIDHDTYYSGDQFTDQKVPGLKATTIYNKFENVEMDFLNSQLPGLVSWKERLRNGWKTYSKSCHTKLEQFFGDDINRDPKIGKSRRSFVDIE